MYDKDIHVPFIRPQYLIFLNTLRPKRDGRHFPGAIFKCIFLSENIWISIKISLILVPKGPNSNLIFQLIEMMAWSRSGDRLLSEPMMVSLLTHICVSRPQWFYQLYILPIVYNETPQDCSISIANALGYCSLALSHRYGLTPGLNEITIIVLWW